MIERIIQQVMSSIPPSSGDDLMGFAIDVEHYLDSCEAIDNISVSETQDHACLLEIRGDITDQVSTV